MDDDSEEDEDDEIYWVIEYHGKSAVEGQWFETYETALAVFQRLPCSTACCLLDAAGSELKYWGCRGGRDKAMLKWFEDQQRMEEEELKRQDEESRRSFNKMFCVVTKPKSGSKVCVGAFFDLASLAKANYKALPWQPAIVLGPGGEVLEHYGSNTDKQEMIGWWKHMSSLPEEDTPREVYYEAVVLNVYDVGCKTAQAVNPVLRPLGSGAYHGAVQVFGREWSYGGHGKRCLEDNDDDDDDDERQTGIYDCVPKGNDMHRFRESVFMGRTHLSRRKVQQLLVRLEEEWPSAKYNVVMNNCCHFCDAFCEKLGVGPSPKWLLDAAERGKGILEAVSEGMDLRGADDDDGYKFGDLTRGAVEQLVRRGKSLSSKPSTGSQGPQLTTCCDFLDFIKGCLNRKWLPS